MRSSINGIAAGILGTAGALMMLVSVVLSLDGDTSGSVVFMACAVGTFVLASIRAHAD